MPVFAVRERGDDRAPSSSLGSEGIMLIFNKVPDDTEALA